MIVYGTHDDRTVQQLDRCVGAEIGAKGVLCADGHVGYSMPIGGVVAYRDHVSPSGVGYDIACGNMAVRTKLHTSDISREEMARIADEIVKRVSFGVGRKNNEPVDDAVFDRIEHFAIPEQRKLLAMARQQLGTVGSGNHYVDLLEDSWGRIWVGVHFGSRGFGHKTATGFLNLANGREFDDKPGRDDMDAPPVLLPVEQPIGQDYIAAMQMAGEYAYAGREAVVNKVLEILGTESTLDRVHNHHNFAWREQHGGETFWVVRKGATPAFPGQTGFVGGSMGDVSVILRGVESEKSAASLYSTVHGAGRVMSRTQAAGKVKRRTVWACGQCDCGGWLPIQALRGQDGSNPKCPTCGSKTHRQQKIEHIRPGAVDFDAVKVDMARRSIILRGAGADEAPQVYRPLMSVLGAHVGTIEILHTLMPRAVVMAGADEIDPYKD